MTGNHSKNNVRFVMGAIAIGCTLYSMLIEGASDVVVFLASLFIIIICITDTLHTKIPNLANLGLIIVGVSYNLYISGPTGLLASLLGLGAGLLLLIIPYLMGGMGAGDVKALAALGALLGPADVYQVFLYVALAGGAMAILHYAMAHNLIKKCHAGLTALRTYIYTKDIRCLIPPRDGERLRFPYAAAIAFGFFAFVQWGALV